MKKRNPWPIGLVLFLAAFAATVVLSAIRLSHERYDLVSSEYYREEIAYESHLESTRRADALSEKPELGVDANTREVWVRFPESIRASGEDAELHLYYAADRRHDLRASVDLAGGAEHRVSLSGRPGGNWRVHLTWKNGGLAYRISQRMEFPK